MKKKAVRQKTRKSSSSKGTSSVRARRETRELVREMLLIARLRAEKCELLESHATYLRVLDVAKRGRDLRGVMEAIAGLLRLASEAQDRESIDRWNSDLAILMQAYPDEVPPMAWYCKGMIAFHQGRNTEAQRDFHRFMKAQRAEQEPEKCAQDGGTPEEVAAAERARDEGLAKGWLMIATCFWRRGMHGRAEWLAHEVLEHYGQKGFHGIVGSTCVLLAWAAERRREFPEALQWLQKAHGSFLADHNWYNHLWLLYSYARLARVQQNYSQAYWYLDLVEKAASGPEFGLLRSEVARERSALEQDAVDLLIDSRRATVQTRESGAISLGKQYVLLHILEALTQAHGREGDDMDRGLSKAEIIESVWRERYRPEAHDNKLYYNINRLRKLLEPDVRKPQYLLNWKEGYRLAPGLRVQLVAGNGIRRLAKENLNDDNRGGTQE